MEKKINLINFTPSLTIWKLWIEIEFSLDLTIMERDFDANSYDLNASHRFEISWNK